MAQKIFEMFKEIDEAVPVSVEFWQLLKKDNSDILVDEIYSFDVTVYDITEAEPVNRTDVLVLPGSVQLIPSLKYDTDTVVVFVLINGEYDHKYDAKFQIKTRRGYIYNEHVYFNIVDPHA